jgi:hypothetical protein
LLLPEKVDFSVRLVEHLYPFSSWELTFLYEIKLLAAEVHVTGPKQLGAMEADGIESAK